MEHVPKTWNALKRQLTVDFDRGWCGCGCEKEMRQGREECRSTLCLYQAEVVGRRREPRGQRWEGRVRLDLVPGKISDGSCPSQCLHLHLGALVQSAQDGGEVQARKLESSGGGEF